MKPEDLHTHLKRSLNEVVCFRFTEGLRALLESGSAEAFLVNLLFLSLRAEFGDSVSREYPLKGRLAVDLVLHARPEIMIEAKQLHLKDGCRFAAPNLANDLRRHKGGSTLGVIYIVDERLSASSQRFARFANANRKVVDKSPRVLDDVVAGLKKTFNIVVPGSFNDSLLRSFDELGGLQIYAFVVSEPLAADPRIEPRPILAD